MDSVLDGDNQGCPPTAEGMLTHVHVRAQATPEPTARNTQAHTVLKKINKIKMRVYLLGFIQPCTKIKVPDFDDCTVFLKQKKPSP